MKPTTLFILFLPAQAAMAQTASPCCRLMATPTNESPTTVRITLTNISDQPIVLQLAAVFDSYQITAQSVEGFEPPRTVLAEGLKGNDRLVGFGQRSQTLRQGQGISQVFDLSLLWTFGEGKYKIHLARKLRVSDRVFLLSSELEIALPRGYAVDRCKPEALANPGIDRRQEPLRGENVPGKSDNLERALAAKVDFLRTPTTNNLALAFMDTLVGAHLSGGMSLTNEGAGASVCLVPGESVRESIGKMQAASPALTFDGRSVIVNVLDDRTSDFLETKIARIELPSPRWAADAAIAVVLAAPEIQTRKKSLALEDVGPLRPPPTTRTQERADAEGPLVLEDVTARQALNAIVQKLDCGIWIYHEWKTGEVKRAFKIELSYGTFRRP